jgi:hypothetical protein
MHHFLLIYIQYPECDSSRDPKLKEVLITLSYAKKENNLHLNIAIGTRFLKLDKPIVGHHSKNSPSDAGSDHMLETDIPSNLNNQ